MRSGDDFITECTLECLCMGVMHGVLRGSSQSWLRNPCSQKLSLKV
jgi:hypothetical protein